MYDLDHMLNGKSSQQHQQEMIEQARLAKLAKIARNAEESHKHYNAAVPQRSIFSSVVLMLTRWA